MNKYILLLGLSLLGLSSRGQTPQADSVNILHYDLHLDITDIQGKTIRGCTQMVFHPLFSNVQGMTLDLFKLEVDSVLLNNQVISYLYNDTLLKVQFPQALGQADTPVLQVCYHGIPAVESYGWGGFHFSGSTLAYNLGIALYDVPHNYGRVWFPCIDNFTSKAAYDFFIRVNDPLVAVCNGLLINTFPQGNGSTVYHWKLEQAIPAYLASVAVSNYVPVQGIYPGIQDSIPTFIYVKPQDTLKARQSFSNLNAIMATFEQRFGPYRWPRVGYVSTPIGAMEHATNIAYPSASIDGTLASEWLLAHELSHMWFGDLVTCQTAGDMWINEGWAVFCEGIFKEGVYGQNAYKDYMRAKHYDVLRNTHHSDGGWFALHNIPDHLTYGSTVYDKGGMVVNTLRGYLGDSLFFHCVQQYLDSFAYRSISSQQMQALFSYLSGTDLADFFDTWVFNAGFPHFAIDSARVIPSGNNYLVTVYTRQRQKGTTHISNSNVLEIGFIAADLSMLTDTIRFSGMLGSKTFTLPFMPEAILLDPGEKIADATTKYTRDITQSGLANFPQTFCSLEVVNCPATSRVRVVHNWVRPDSLWENLPGFQISPQRFWTVEGVLAAGFRSKVKFAYSKFQNLDNELITNQNDSLVLLYRPSRAMNWQAIPFLQNGSTYQGELIVDSLRLGEYVLGIWDHHYLGLLEKEARGLLNIHPNPGYSALNLSINTRESASLHVFHASGMLLDSVPLPAGSTQLSWKPKSGTNGLYLFRVMNTSGDILAEAKAILLH